MTAAAKPRLPAALAEATKPFGEMSLDAAQSIARRIVHHDTDVAKVEVARFGSSI